MKLEMHKAHYDWGYKRDGSSMGDLFFVGVAVITFGVLWAFARGCEALRK